MGAYARGPGRICGGASAGARRTAFRVLPGCSRGAAGPRRARRGRVLAGGSGRRFRSRYVRSGGRARAYGGHSSARDRTGRASVPDNGPVLEMTREEFEELVAESLDRIPPELTRLMDNVAVFVEDEPPADDPELLGLYEGTPLTDRGEWYAGVLPDRITIYRGPTLRMCESREDVVAETEVTVVHEIAHHFGIDDARLHALGYG
ncbi:hypothetical protein GCM10010515_68140 [Streptomyces fructofermentans]|uniref:Metallopeptidase family protein n=1 Tax=Streptomyces fructofermentans TaxID=152141 RepID=A0A918U4Y5_9ACTN|nr:hypothetical protein GCM10010515_68140 [Streptomyces fructofermentans]